MTDELKRAIEGLGDYEMSSKELEAQRISFAYGNGSSDDHDTKDSVKRAVELSQMS